MGLIKKMKDPVRLKYDAVSVKPNIVNVNEMEMNELDFGT